MAKKNANLEIFFSITKIFIETTKNFFDMTKNLFDTAKNFFDKKFGPPSHEISVCAPLFSAHPFMHRCAT